MDRRIDSDHIRINIFMVPYQVFVRSQIMFLADIAMVLDVNQVSIAILLEFEPDGECALFAGSALDFQVALSFSYLVNFFHVFWFVNAHVLVVQYIEFFHVALLEVVEGVEHCLGLVLDKLNDRYRPEAFIRVASANRRQNLECRILNRE